MKTLGLTIRNLKEIFRDPITLVLGLALPMLFLFLFSSLFKNNPMQMFSPQALTPGVVVFGYAFTIMFSAILIAKDKQSAFLMRLFATPLKPAHFITAYMLPFLPFTLFQTAISFITAAFMGATFSNLGSVAVILFFAAIMCISVGVLLGSLFTVNQVSGIGSILITLISLFSGAWMDLKSVGGIFETVGTILPFTHAINASRNLLAGASLANSVTELSILLLYSVVFIFAAAIAFSYTMRRK